MIDKKASELLLESAEPFDKACMMVREMEKELEGLKKHLVESVVIGLDLADKPDIHTDILQVGDIAYEMTEAFKKGFEDAAKRVPYRCCPFPHSTRRKEEWEQAHYIYFEHFAQ